MDFRKLNLAKRIKSAILAKLTPKVRQRSGAEMTGVIFQCRGCNKIKHRNKNTQAVEWLAPPHNISRGRAVESVTCPDCQK